MLDFGVAGEVSTGGGNRGRQKLGGSWRSGRIMFRVYTKRVQECMTN